MKPASRESFLAATPTLALARPEEPEEMLSARRLCCVSRPRKRIIIIPCFLKVIRYCRTAETPGILRGAAGRDYAQSYKLVSCFKA